MRQDTFMFLLRSWITSGGSRHPTIFVATDTVVR